MAYLQKKRKTGPKGPTKFTQEFVEKEAEALIKWIADAGDDPKKVYLGTFCVERGYDRQRLVEMADANFKFADALRQGKIWQEAKLLSFGLNRQWDSPLVKYTLSKLGGEDWKEDKSDLSKNMESFARDMAAIAGKTKDIVTGDASN